MLVKAFYHQPSCSISYIVYDPTSKDAVVIDPVLDFDSQTWSINTTSMDSILEFVREEELLVHWILDTHAHADHISAMHQLKSQLNAKTAIGNRIIDVQEHFFHVFDVETSIEPNGQQWNLLLHDGNTINAGTLTINVISTPGHTPSCTSYLIDNCVFVGDTLFMPDFGTGRCDFPNGNTDELFDSVTNKLYSLPDDTRIFVGHDYQPGGRELRFETSVKESKTNNIHLNENSTREEFKSFRQQRDSQLPPPALLYQSLQANIVAGKLPTANAKGQRFFKMPINAC